MAAKSLCPARDLARIASSFARACDRHGMKRDSSHPRAAHLVWRSAGGRLGNALTSMDGIVRDAAARGVSTLGLGTIALRMMGGAR